jgi:hypothetical protein
MPLPKGFPFRSSSARPAVGPGQIRHEAIILFQGHIRGPKAAAALGFTAPEGSANEQCSGTGKIPCQVLSRPPWVFIC